MSFADFAGRFRLPLLFLPFAVLLLCKPVLPEWATVWPERFALPFTDWINAAADFLRKEKLVAGLSFKDMTRAASSLIEWPLDFVYALTTKGFPPFPPLPWTTAAGLAAVFGWWAKGWRTSLLAGGCIFYFALFGKWKLSMITLSAVLVAAAVACAAGLALGIAAARRPRLEKIILPLLNVMQTLPHFSYLIPIAVFVGISHKAGVIATILFAIPPMTRLTLLGLRGVPSEVLEAGKMAGCTARQMLYKVEIPAARDSLMVGVNQVIMQCLAMVVIASFVGTKGLGQDLLFRLQSLRIGQALEIGVAIVFMAVALDRLSLAVAHRQPGHLPHGAFWKRHPAWTAAAAVVCITFILSAITESARKFPSEWTITTAPFWDGLVDHITQNYFDALSFYRDGFLVNILIPLRKAFQWTPWVAVLALVAAAGWHIVGRRAVAPILLFLFIALSGFWERAVITAYAASFAVFVCILFGVPLGIWAAGGEKRSRAAVFLCDTFQTFPSFIYLIPVIMLFRVGDVAIITAIVIYAIIPPVRYTVFGLRKVPPQTVEAAKMSGCTPWQLLWKVRLPLASPEIMLGVHQTVMFSLFMVIIAAFIGGTKDLGQEMFRAMAHSDIGKALVIGLCVSAMGLISDSLIGGWAAKRKKELGLP
ncbi:MAG: ABC transporter permease [Gammaproteobacteria bacterium]